MVSRQFAAVEAAAGGIRLGAAEPLEVAPCLVRHCAYRQDTECGYHPAGASGVLALVEAHLEASAA